MARIVVQADDQRTVLLDEKEVRSEHLNDEHSAAQLLERLEWAIRDAERRKAGALRRPGDSRPQGASGPRSASRPRRASRPRTRRGDQSRSTVRGISNHTRVPPS